MMEDENLLENDEIFPDWTMTEESTLDSSGTDRQTDRAPAPKDYVSVRVTLTHEQWPVIEQCFLDFPWYISYPHLGKNGNNPHFHVCVPGCKRDSNKIRERLKGAGLSGNQQFSIKCHQNGVESFIQYASREKTTPKTRGSVDKWIADAPKWLHANLKTNLNPFTGKRKADDMMQDMRPINAKNVMYAAWAYRRDCLVSDPKGDRWNKLSDVILHMLDSAKYYIDPTFARQGVPDFYLDVFSSSCKVGKLTFARDQKQWTNVLFRPVNSRW